MVKMRRFLGELDTRAKKFLERCHQSVIPYRISTADMFVGVLLALFFLFLYYYTCSHHLNAAGDSPELIGTSYSLGIAHPPGYPLYTMLGYIVSHIPVGTVPFRLNFLSSIFHALTLFFVFASLLKLTRNRIAASIATAALGLSALFWSYSLVAEVFSLNNLFASLLVFLSISAREKWVREDYEASRRSFALLAFFCGLSLTNHHTILLFFPAIILFAAGPLYEVLRSPKHLLLSALAFFAGLLPYAYLPWRASQAPLLNFEDPSSLRGFLSVITRRYYGTSRLWGGPQARHRLDLVFRFISSSWNEVHLVGTALSLIGLVYTARKRRIDFIPLFIGLVMLGMLFPLMANVDIPDTFALSTIERFFLLPLLILVFFLGIGVGRVIELARGLVGRIPVREEIAKSLLWLVAFLLALPFLLPASSTVENVSLRDDLALETFFDNLLRSADENSLVFVIGDVTSEASMYYEAVTEECERRGITFFTYPFMFNAWYLDSFSKHHPDIKVPRLHEIPPEALVNRNVTTRWFVEYVIENNPHIKSFYINDPRKELKEGFLLLPWGTLFKILDKDTEVDIAAYYQSQLDYWRNLDLQGLDVRFYPFNSRSALLPVETALYPASCGEFLSKKGEHKKAATFFNLALHIAFSTDHCRNLAQAYYKMGQVDKAIFFLGGVFTAESPESPKYWEDFLLFEEMLAERSES